MWSRLFILFVLQSCSQLLFPQGFNIEFTIHGLKDTSVFLGYHYGEKQYLIDTVRLDHNGHARFRDKKETLPQGIYFIATPGFGYFDILIPEKQAFSLETDTAHYLNFIRFNGSPDNQKFADYLRYTNKISNNSKFLIARWKKNKGNPDSVKVLGKMIDTNDSLILAYLKSEVIANKGSMYAGILNSMLEPEIPAYDPGNVANKDSVVNLYKFRYYKNHYFDQLDFSKSWLVRTPILEKKIFNYMTKMVSDNTDSLILESDKLIARSLADEAVFHYVSGYLLNFFETTQPTSNDEAFVHIAEKWIIAKQADELDEAFLYRLQSRINTLKPLLVGKQAPDLIFETLNGQKLSINNVQSPYTVLFFWDPTCEHCTAYLPGLIAAYNKFRHKGIEIMAIYTEADRAAWEKYISEHELDWINAWDPENKTDFRNIYDLFQTPRVYVLDDKKIIIAKDIPMEKLDGYFTGLLGK
jgi:peroxiredoxin